jgi:hypothetical protein
MINQYSILLHKYEKRRPFGTSVMLLLLVVGLIAVVGHGTQRHGREEGIHVSFSERRGSYFGPET